MTTEHKEETGPVTVQIGVCSVCHILFLISGDRQTSPCCGSDPLAILATLTIGPNAQVTGEWGFGPLISADEMKEKLELPVAEEQPAPAEEAPEEEEERQKSPLLDFSGMVAAYWAGVDVGPEELNGALQELGADPETAATAVGRLDAVRELLWELQLARELAPFVPAQPEAESSPENT